MRGSNRHVVIVVKDSARGVPVAVSPRALAPSAALFALRLAVRVGACAILGVALFFSFGFPRTATARPQPAETSAVLPGGPIETIPPEKLVPGMKGYGVSDLGDGKGIQRFEVEILGILKRYAPRQDLVLARVSGAGLERTGIIAGMSGSPIYVGGKLVGALAYGWPFAKDATCGITPIQSMLDIRHAPPGPPVPIGGASGNRSAASAGAGSLSTRDFVQAFSEGHFRDRMDDLLKPLRAVSS
nr:hypothetical protein [Acidobacteriota bacterium]